MLSLRSIALRSANGVLGVLVSVLLLAMMVANTAARADEPTVFAAASLTNAMEELGKLYATHGNQPVRFSFAASSALARQIEGGAPATIFASADEQWMDYLADRQLIVPTTRISPIGNRLVLIVPAGSSITSVDVTKGVDLAPLLGEGRLATGDPDHVPVGRYAKEALTTLGAWGQLEPRLARTESVRVALALVERGEVPLGIVYATDAAQTDKVRVVGTFPADSHQPITYPMAIIAADDGPPARALLAFLTGDDAKAVYRKLGFSVE
jgi:molybdenum ABC transporter, periplasmic molybdate-binding protein